MVGIFPLASSGRVGMGASFSSPKSKYWQTGREECEFWCCIFSQNKKTVQGFSQYSFILLTNLFVFFSFLSFSIQEISLQLSHTFICLSCSLNRKISDSVLGTSFLSHVFSRTGSLQDNFKNNLFHIAAILFTGLNLSGFLLVPHCNSDLVPVSLQVSLEFAAWVSRCGGCVWAKYPVGFLNRPLARAVTFDLQGLRWDHPSGLILLCSCSSIVVIFK